MSELLPIFEEMAPQLPPLPEVALDRFWHPVDLRGDVWVLNIVGQKHSGLDWSRVRHFGTDVVHGWCRSCISSCSMNTAIERPEGNAGGHYVQYVPPHVVNAGFHGQNAVEVGGNQGAIGIHDLVGSLFSGK